MRFCIYLPFLFLLFAIWVPCPVQGFQEEPEEKQENAEPQTDPPLAEHRARFENPEADEATLAISAGELIKGGDQEWLKARLREGKITQPGILAIVSAFWINKDTRALREILLLSITNENEEVRKRSKKTLGFFMQDQSTRAKMVEKLLEILRAQDSSKELLLAALEALGQTGALKAVEALIPFTAREEVELRNQAAESLKALTYQEFGANEDAWKAWWENNKHKSRDRIIEPVLKGEIGRLESESRILNEKNLELALRLIQGNPEEAVTFLKDTDMRVRRRAAEEIAANGVQVKVKEVVLKGVIAHLEQGERDQETLKFLFKLIGREHKQPAAQGVLLKYLREDERDLIKCEAARNLHGFKSDVVRQAAVAILQALKEEKGRIELKVQLLDLLYSVGSMGAMDLLVHFKDRNEKRIKEVAVKAMGASRAEKAIEILENVLAVEPDSDVRFEATGSLDRLRREICTPESGLTAKMVSALKTGLRNREDRIRAHCITILGELAPPDGLAILEEHLKTEEVSGVRERCIWSLGRIGDPAGLDVILRALPAGENIKAQGTEGQIVECTHEAVKSICGDDLNRWMQAIESFFRGGQFFLAINFCKDYETKSKAKGKNGDDDQSLRVGSIRDEAWYHLFLAEGSLDKALERARNLKQRAPNNIPYLRMLTHVLVRMKKFNEAHEEYKILLEIVPAEEVALQWQIKAEMAECLLELKDAKGVVKLLERFPGGGAKDLSEELIKRVEASMRKAKEILAEEKPAPSKSAKDTPKPAKKPAAKPKEKTPQPKKGTEKTSESPKGGGGKTLEEVSR